MSTTPKYTRLPGRAGRNGLIVRRGVYTLYLADDHLLHVRTVGYTEESKRFDLMDIQAISITPARNTASEVFGTISLFLMGAVLLAIYFAIGEFDLPGPLPFLIGLGVLLAPALVASAVLLVLRAVAGPACACVLHTAAQGERLYAQGRLYTARRVAALLAPRIAAAQSTPAASQAEPPPPPPTLDVSPPLL